MKVDLLSHLEIQDNSMHSEESRPSQYLDIKNLILRLKKKSQNSKIVSYGKNKTSM